MRTAREFTANLAGWVKNGEVLDGEVVQMNGIDALEVLFSFVDEARQIADAQPRAGASPKRKVRVR